MEKEQLRQRYNEVRQKYAWLRTKARRTMKQALRRKGIKVHWIEARIKKFDSFYDKVQRKKCENPFEEIDDICGLRVVCLLRSQMEPIAAVIRESFVVLDEDNKVEGLDFSSSAYSAVHFVAKLKEPGTESPGSPIGQLKFEIQLLSIAMHCWASVSHYLDYKNDVDVPSELKQDFRALGALFYLADTHFEMFYDQRARWRDKLERILEERPGALDSEINLDALIAYLQYRFPNRPQVHPNFVSLLVYELFMAGYRSIRQVDDVVQSSNLALAALEEDMSKPHPHETYVLPAILVVRCSLELVDDRFRKMTKVPAPPRKYRKLLTSG
jgi:ppGpp synthetase/RelA/SpoT-type nucleotidyltranferase